MACIDWYRFGKLIIISLYIYYISIALLFSKAILNKSAGE